MSSNKEKNREIFNITLDETKSTVKKTTDDALKEFHDLQKPLTNINKRPFKQQKILQIVF
jgi:hypothetical protein